MKRYTRILTISICALLLAAFLALAVGCGGGGTSSTSSTAEKVLKVGMILPYTGAAAEKGKPGGDAVKDAMEYVNAELNGANGVKIQIDWRDSQYKADNVATIIKDFQNNGEALFTTMSSAEMTAAMAIANRAGFPGLVTFAAPGNVNPPAHIYAHMPDYGDDWIAFVNYYKQNIWKGSGKPKMALLLLSNTTGSSVKDVARARAAELGIDLIDYMPEHNADTLSEMEAMTNIKSRNPDVIYIASTPKPTSVILKNARDLGMLGGQITIGLGHAAITKSLIELAGKDVVEGVYGAFPTLTWDDPSPAVAKAKEYLQKFNHSENAGNMDYLACWATSLVVADILRTAVKNAGYDALAKGDASAWKVVEEQGIQKLNGYDVEGIQGPVSYTPGSNKLGTAVKIYEIKNGQMTPMGDWIQAR